MVGKAGGQFPENLVRLRSKVVIDGTALSTEEAREFHDIDRELAGRSLKTPKQKRLAARRDALKERIIYSRFLARQLCQARAIAASQQRAA